MKLRLPSIAAIILVIVAAGFYLHDKFPATRAPWRFA